MVMDVLDQQIVGAFFSLLIRALLGSDVHARQSPSVIVADHGLSFSPSQALAFVSPILEIFPCPTHASKLKS
jgi:hypothetical protein